MDAMTRIESIRSRITNANAQSANLNNKRQVNIGKRATLEAQLEKAFADYEAKYGKRLTPDTVEAEMVNVATEKEAEVARIEEMITLIQGGNFEQAMALANGNKVEEVAQSRAEVVTSPVVEASAVSAPVTETPVVPTQAEPAAAQIPTPPVAPAPVTPTQSQVTPPTAPVMPSMPTAPVMPSAPTIPATPVAPTMPTAPTPPADPFNLASTGGGQMNALGGLGGALAGFQPANGGMPIEGLGSVQPASPMPSSPTNFQSILGGTAFDSNNV